MWSLTDSSSEDEVPASNEEAEERKKQVLLEIAALEDEISKIVIPERPKKPTTFGEWEALTKNKETPEDTFVVPRNKESNPDDAIKKDLYKFAGLHCSSMKDNKTVIKMCVPDFDMKIVTYSVELYTDENSTKLGKYHLPTSITARPLAEQLLGEEKNTDKFIKTCKHLIICYHSRKRQFCYLQKTTKESKNLKFFHNDSYTYVTLEFYGVRVAGKDKQYNFSCHLIYAPGKVLPEKVTVCEVIIGTKTFSKEIEDQFLAFVEPFEQLKLRRAFKKVVTNKDTAVKWQPLKRAIGNDSDSDSEEEEDSDNSFIKTLKSAKKKKKFQNPDGDSEKDENSRKMEEKKQDKIAKKKTKKTLDPANDPGQRKLTESFAAQRKKAGEPVQHSEREEVEKSSMLEKKKKPRQEKKANAISKIPKLRKLSSQNLQTSTPRRSRRNDAVPDPELSKVEETPETPAKKLRSNLNPPKKVQNKAKKKR